MVQSMESAIQLGRVQEIPIMDKKIIAQRLEGSLHNQLRNILGAQRNIRELNPKEYVYGNQSQAEPVKLPIQERNFSNLNFNPGDNQVFSRRTTMQKDDIQFQKNRGESYMSGVDGSRSQGVS